MHPHAPLHGIEGDGQGRAGGGGTEGEGPDRPHFAKQHRRGKAGEAPEKQSVHHQAMEHQHPQHGEKIRRQVDDRPQAHGGEQLGQQGEHAVGSQLHENFHHLHDHRFHIAEEAADAAALLPRVGDGIADQQGKDDDLQHLALGHGAHRVGRHHVHQHIRKRRGRRGLEVGGAHQVDIGAGIDQAGEKQRDADGDGGGGQVQGHGLEGDGTHPGAVAQGTGAADQRNQHQRHYQQFQQGHENAPHHIEQAVAGDQVVVYQFAQALGRQAALQQHIQQGAQYHSRQHGQQYAVGQAHWGQDPVR